MNEMVPRGRGTEVTKYNAVRHGLTSAQVLLPWEDARQYDALLAALVAEHAPEGPTQEHLVEELASILWRKRRLRLAEAAEIRRGLAETLMPFRRTAQAALAHVDASDCTVTVEDAIQASTAHADDGAGEKRIKRRDTYSELIASQAYGEAVRPERLETLARYEAHLNRQLQKMLATLLRLQELRAGQDQG